MEMSPATKQAIKWGLAAAFFTLAAGIVGVAIILYARKRDWKDRTTAELISVAVGIAVGMVVHVLVAPYQADDPTLS